jgi:hypothetical protein
MPDLKLQLVKKQKAHLDSPITKIIENPYVADQIITTGLDGQVKIWKLPSLSL